MDQDFIANYLYFLYSKDKDENPMPQKREWNLFQKIRILLNIRDSSGQIESKGE